MESNSQYLNIGVGCHWEKYPPMVIRLKKPIIQT